MENDPGERSDLEFCSYHKRIHRFHVGLPEDWGGGATATVYRSAAPVKTKRWRMATGLSQIACPPPFDHP